MKKKTIGKILKAPAILLLIASLAAGVYAAANNIQDMGWEVPIIITVVLVMYFIGASMGNKKENQITEYPEETQEEEQNLNDEQFN